MSALKHPEWSREQVTQLVKGIALNSPWSAEEKRKAIQNADDRLALQTPLADKRP
jgi:hypothetical protein